MSNPFAPGGDPTPPPSPPPASGGGNPFGTPTAPPSSQGWGTTPEVGPVTSAAPLRATSGPWPFIIAALITSVVGVGLGLAAWLTSTATEPRWLTLAVAGWVLAGIITFILAGLHISADTKRQAESLYISNPTQTLLYRAALGLGVIGVIITAVEIALWFGKAFGG